MIDPQHLVVFNLDDNSYAVRLSAVERVVRAVEITQLPKAPDIVMGVINVGGKIVPVLDIRARFGLQGREVKPGDQFIIAGTKKRTVALAVDEVSGTIECCDRNTVHPEQIVPGLQYVAGVIKLPDGMLLLHDLDDFLSLEDEEILEAAMDSETERCGGSDEPYGQR